MKKSKKEDRKGDKDHSISSLGYFSVLGTMLKSKWESTRLCSFPQRALPRVSVMQKAWNDTLRRCWFFHSSAAHTHTVCWQSLEVPRTPNLKKLPKLSCPTDTLLRPRQSSSPSCLACKLYNTGGGWNMFFLVFLFVFLWTLLITNIYIFSSENSTSKGKFHEKIKLKNSFGLNACLHSSWFWLIICKHRYIFLRKSIFSGNKKIL